MKQTNNAIKFLMAQYRAIFKNANIAMVAAMAAAALAAGQAQAQVTNITDWNQIVSGTIDANTTNGKALAIVADADKTESKGFDLTITSGSHTIKGKSGQNELTTAKDKTTTITLNGDGAAVAQPTLSIGGTQAGEHVAVTITNLNNFAGTLSIAGQGTNKSSLTATNIQIGGSAPAADGAAKAAAASKAVVSLGASGEIIAAKGGTFNILNGGELKFSGAASKAKAESGITLNGGKISVADSATGTVEGALTVTSGAVEVNGGAADTTLTVSGLATINDGTFDIVKGGSAASGGKAILSNGITMNGGTLTVQGDTTDAKSGKLEVSGAATFNTGSKLAVQKSGTATFNGNLTLADGTIENAGTVALNIAKAGTSTLTVGAEGLAELIKGKLSVSGAAPTNSEQETFKLVIDSDVDLVKAGLVKETDGTAADTFVIDASVENSSLTAKKVTIGAGTYGATKTLSVDSLTAGKDGAFKIGKDLTATIKNGLTVTADGKKADLTVNGNLNLEGAGSVIGANKIELVQDTSTPKLNVNNGTWGVKDLTLTSGTATVTGEGTKLNVTGMLTTTANGDMAIKNNAVVDASSGDLTLVEGKVALTGGSTLILDSADVFKIDGGNVTLVTPKGEVKSKFEQGAVKTDGTSILQLNYSGNLAVADLDKIKNAIDKNTGLKGFIRLEGANITGKPTEDVTLTEAKEGFDGLYDNVAIKVDTAAGTVDKSFTAAQIKLTNASATGAAIADSKKVLLKGDGQNGNFVMKSNTEVADVSLGSGSALVLAGSGKVGDIKATAAANTGKASLAIGHSAATGTVNANSIDGGKAGLDVSVFNSTLNVAGKVAAKDLTLDGSALKITAEAGSGSVSADTLSVGSGSSIFAKGQDITIAGTAASEILGDVTAKLLSIAGSEDAKIAGDAVLTLDTMTIGGTGVVQVGDDAAEKNGSATVVVQNLTGEGTLFVDPKYTEKAALVIANNLSGSSTPDNEQDAGTLQGSAIVGNNAALGIGFASEAELKAVLGQFLEADDGSFTENPAADKLELANALVLNKHIDIASNKGITVKKGATKNDTPSGNSVTLEAGTGLIVTDNVYKVLDDGSKSGAAITFGASGTVSSSGGKVILSGNFDGEDNALEIFSNVQTVSGTLTVQSANGLLKGEINDTNKGKVNLDVNEDALKGAFTGVSAPVAELLKNTIRGEYKGAKGLGADFVYTVAGTSLTGAEADAAAHAATYAGAQQAAVAAVTTMADAMFGRVGAVGVEAASISATGSQANGGVWLTPMYKSVDSDGFNAEGVSYGSDVDLAGVAFGTDTVNGNMRFGAVFNIGSGDAEGKGQGNGLKDEFDYYGFGIYSAMGFGNFALVGDASMTVISHDVEGFGLKGKADTTAVTMGVTGQYTFATPMVDVTPHLGARFIRLNTDSYDLTSADGVLATTDFDVQNVFSVPVGVTLSKAFVAGGWSLAPSADLTIAFNTGDTDAKSNTQFNSSKPMSVATNTEVLDEVTYGLTLGLGAQYGAFGTSFGINYTGSSNTDSLGVNAQARYMF